MHSFLEFLTEALLYLSIAAIVGPMLTPILWVIDKLIGNDNYTIKPNAPKIILGSMAGGMIVLLITAVLIKTGILPHISLFNNPNLEHYWVQ